MMNRWLINRGYPMSQLRQELDRVFDESFGNRPWSASRARRVGQTFPAVNVWETDDRLMAEAEVPGLRMDDLEILVDGSELTIKGERRHEEQEGVTYHRRERGTGTFCGVVSLPVEVDVEKTEASLSDGVLTVAMPKSARARSRKIEVKASND